MPAKIYYDQDADLSLLKDKTIAILGYGSQGHAQAQNLRDSGCKVIIAELPGSANYKLAVEHGFQPLSAEEATKKADLINILLPDEIQGDVYRQHIMKQLQPGNVLMCSHGFNIHFGQIEPPPGVDALLVAPKGPGHLVRSEFVKGGGVPCLVAVNDGASDLTLQLGLAYAKGIGGTRGGVIQTSFAEETETDLFGEQVVLCGGVSELVRAAFETLVDAGYQPEMAYFECLHELKLIVDLLRRLHSRPAYCHRTNPRGNEEDPGGDPVRTVRPRVDPGEQGRRTRFQSPTPPATQATARGGRQATPQPDDLDRRQRSLLIAKRAKVG